MGPKEFSEVEAQNVKVYLEGLPIKPMLGLSIHCCYGWILLPYGYDYDTYPDNKLEIVRNGCFFAIELDYLNTFMVLTLHNVF